MSGSVLSFTTNNAYEASMLRSVILFSGEKTVPSRKSSIETTVLSIIGVGDGKYGRNSIMSTLTKRFHLTEADIQIDDVIASLQKKGLIETVGDKYLIKENESNSALLEQLNADTEALIDDIISGVKDTPRLTVSQQMEGKLRENIKAALSQYFYTCGYTFFNVMQKTGKKEEAVSLAKKELPNDVGQALVGSLANILTSPTEQQRRTLEQWAKAYVTMEVLNLDPALRGFKSTKLRDKVFVIDTDVALYLLAKYTPTGKAYRELMQRLSKIGCRIMIPEFVKGEIGDHIEGACRKATNFGSYAHTMPEEIYSKNVFLADYVNRYNEADVKTGFSFSNYIRNIHIDKDTSLLDDNLKEGLSSPLNNFDTSGCNEADKQSLAERILHETEQTAKGMFRYDEQNKKMADNDATLFLSVLRENKGTENNGKPLCRKTYLLSESKKTVKCAREMGLDGTDVICDPRALIAFLYESGLGGSEVPSYINLFENPFLVDSSQRIWEPIEKLLNKGIVLSNTDIGLLRRDVDSKIDRILTCRSNEEIAYEAKRLKDRNYKFADFIAELTSAKDEADKKRAAAEKELEELKRQIRENKNAADWNEAGKKERIKRLKNRTKRKK